MSNTDFLKQSEAHFLPPGYVQGKMFDFKVGDYQGKAELDGWNPQTLDAIEICQSETDGQAPKPGQKRKMASDVLKLVFLKSNGLISSGHIFVTSQEMYTWLHQSGSWLSAACRYFGIRVELKHFETKRLRKRTRNVISKARREMKG